ncbi:MAG: tyrosine-protein phosphatase [Cyclobacteriaceae bacterium]
MKQHDVIHELKELLYADPAIKSACIYGSFARKTETVNSDIDLAITVGHEFNVRDLLDELREYFSDKLLKVMIVALRNKIVLYFRDMPKAEIAFADHLSEHDRNYLGSEIPYDNIADSILFDKAEEVLRHLQKITKAKESISDKDISSLLDKFVYEFESCSNAHRRSDGYHFYFFYNIALHVAIQLNYLAKGHIKFNFLPKNLIANVLTGEEQNGFYELKGSLFLPEANDRKRRLLDFFYTSVSGIVSQARLHELREFCEAIYCRDFLWNFRDIGMYNPAIKSGIVFRTATMTLFQHEDFFERLIDEKNIRTVIDMRAKKEIAESKYSEASLQKLTWIHAPFDPWNQSEEFQAAGHQGTDIKIAYRFFATECKHSVRKALEAILQEPHASALHCYAGKDRTGIIVSMLHLLSGADRDRVYEDYLASESDTKREYIDIVLDIIDEENGVESYLLSCGLTKDQLSRLKHKLFY